MPDVMLVAILRGVTPDEVVGVGEVLYRAGVRAIEVPLNSPDALTSVSRLREHLPAACRVGAGTVLSAADVAAAGAAGAELIVSPNTDEDVIRATLDAGMTSIPGAATPTEAFRAIRAGARDVKVFPAETVGPAGVRAWRAVLPGRVRLLPVGGIDATTIPAFLDAGAGGFGIGSSLYRPGIDPGELARRASAVVAAVRNERGTP